MKALCVFLGLIIVGAVAAGVLLGGSEWLSPSLHRARADRLEAETAAIQAQVAYEQRQREMALRQAEQKAAVELQALQDRRARELELLEIAGIVGQVVGSIVAILLAVAVSYYLIAKARALMKGQEVKEIQRPDQKTLPSMSERKQESNSDSIQRSNVSAFHVSYDGLLAFCADFILSNGRRVLLLDCTQPDDRRRYYTTGISPDVTQIYFLILRQARIITSGTNGCSEWTLRQKISKIDDIRLRIPREKFDEVSNLYLRLNRIGIIMTAPKTELEHNLDWTQ